MVYQSCLAEAVKRGARIIFLTPEDGKGEWVFDEKRISYKKIYDYSDSDTIINDFTAVNYIDSEEIEPLLFSYKKPSFFDKTMGAKDRLPVAAGMEYGAGRVTFLSLCLEGRVGCNPTLDEFLSIIFQ